jgi:hypothetical protein
MNPIQHLRSSKQQTNMHVLAVWLLQVFACGHYYCDDCAQQALSVPKPTCPYCRKAITRTGVFRCAQL